MEIIIKMSLMIYMLIISSCSNDKNLDSVKSKNDYKIKIKKNLRTINYDSSQVKFDTVIVKSININKLFNTKWFFELSDDCINIINFNKNYTFDWYNCELNKKNKGVFYLKRDTLFLKEYFIINNELNGKYIKTDTILYSTIIKGNKLFFIKKRELIDGKYISSKFKFNDLYFYEKSDVIE